MCALFSPETARWKLAMPENSDLTFDTSPPPQPLPPLRSSFADDPEMAGLIGEFVEQLPARCAQLSAARRGNDFPSLACLAHQLKGAGGGYGYDCITEAALVLEQHARAGNDLAAIDGSIRELTDLCRRAAAGVTPSSIA